MDGGAWWTAVHGVTNSRTWLSDVTFTFYFPAWEMEMVTHSSVVAWRIPGMGEPGGLPSMGSHRVRHNWSDLAAAAAFFTGCHMLHCLSQLVSISLSSLQMRNLRPWKVKWFYVMSQQSPGKPGGNMSCRQLGISRFLNQRVTLWRGKFEMKNYN